MQANREWTPTQQSVLYTVQSLATGVSMTGASLLHGTTQLQQRSRLNTLCLRICTTKGECKRADDGLA